MISPLPRLSRPLALAAFCLLAVAAFANTAAVPSTRPDYSAEQQAKWLKRHEEFVETARRGGVDVLFIGDSITDYWRTKGKDIWDRTFAPLQAANFGLAGDRIQQVLWRMINGELDGIHPKAVVVLIGTNNTANGMGGENSLTPRNTTPEIIAGIGVVVQTLRTHFPDARILLLGIFPRGDKNAPVRAQIKEINAGIRHLDDGHHVKFLDIGDRFLSPDGSIAKEIMPDQLHPTTAAYQLWADAIKNPLSELLAR